MSIHIYIYWGRKGRDTIQSAIAITTIGTHEWLFLRVGSNMTLQVFYPGKFTGAAGAAEPFALRRRRPSRVGSH